MCYFTTPFEGNITTRFLYTSVVILLHCVVNLCLVNFSEVSRVHPNCVQTALAFFFLQVSEAHESNLHQTTGKLHRKHIELYQHSWNLISEEKKFLGADYGGPGRGQIQLRPQTRRRTEQHTQTHQHTRSLTNAHARPPTHTLAPPLIYPLTRPPPPTLTHPTHSPHSPHSLHSLPSLHPTLHSLTPTHSAHSLHSLTPLTPPLTSFTPLTPPTPLTPLHSLHSTHSTHSTHSATPLTPSLPHSLTPSLLHSFTPSLLHPLSHPPTHSLTPSLVCLSWHMLARYCSLGSFTVSFL